MLKHRLALTAFGAMVLSEEPPKSGSATVARDRAIRRSQSRDSKMEIPVSNHTLTQTRRLNMPPPIVRKCRSDQSLAAGLTSKCQSWWGQFTRSQKVAALRMLAIVFSVPLIASTAAAQIQVAGAPGGSYRQSCIEIQTAGDPRTPARLTVSARCKTKVWGYEYAQIDLKRCEPNADGLIRLTNRNGDLLCEGPYPPGSYLRSVRMVS